MSGYRSPLLRDGYQPQPNPLMRALTPPPAPSWGNAADQAWATIQAKLEEQQRISQERGLWTGGQAWEGGHPTVKGVADAAQQYAGTFEGGIKAFHASPYSFEWFDTSKIGSGQGAQAYGHGLYAAESPAVSGGGGQYDQEFTAKNLGKTDLNQQELSILKGIREGKSDLDLLREQARMGASFEEAQSAVDRVKAAKAHIYEVDINVDPERMLHWDKPLSEQHPDVQAAVEKLGIKSQSRPDEDPTGAALYHRMQEGEIGARAMREAGIPGIRYLDQNSRAPRAPIDLVGGKPYDPSDPSHGAAMALTWTNGDRNAAAAQLDKLALSSESAPQMRAAADYLRGDRPVLPLTQGEPPLTHNIVMFDANTIDILRKYGIAGLGIGLGATATQGGE